MNMQRVLGLAVLALGITLLVIGMNSSHSFSDQVSNTFTGRFTDRTTWFIVGGIVIGVAGLGMTALGFRGKGT